MRNPGLESGTGIPDQKNPGRDGNPGTIRESNICEIITLKNDIFIWVSLKKQGIIYLSKLKEPEKGYQIIYKKSKTRVKNFLKKKM